MKWLVLMLCLFGCQQDEMMFRTIRRVPQAPAAQIILFKECSLACEPPSYCDTATGKCAGKAIKNSPSSKKEGETELVLDKRYGRPYGEIHENY